MKVAMVTPYYRENIDIIRRCHDSVQAQSYADVTHVVVADGYANSAIDDWDCEHIRLPVSHRDAGATPRALGALSAFSRGYDAVGFIDADNGIDPDHVEQMVALAEADQAQFVIATRRIHCGINGRALYTDLVESNGVYMVDTNCMFFTRACARLLTSWIVPADQVLINDRTFWGAVKSSGLRIAKCTQPTVSYATKWAFHYGYAGVEIPGDSVWFRYANPERTSIRRDNAGLIRHCELSKAEQDEALELAIRNLPPITER